MREIDYDNLTDEDRAWLKAWNKPIPDEVEPEEGMEDELVYDLSGLRKPALQHQARLRELDDGGTVAELQARIEELDAEEYEEEE